jgi:hypothetical protein
VDFLDHPHPAGLVVFARGNDLEWPVFLVERLAVPEFGQLDRTVVERRTELGELEDRAMLPDPRAEPGSAVRVSERFAPELNCRIDHRSPHPL